MQRRVAPFRRLNVPAVARAPVAPPAPTGLCRTLRVVERSASGLTTSTTAAPCHYTDGGSVKSWVWFADVDPTLTGLPLRDNLLAGGPPEGGRTALRTCTLVRAPVHTLIPGQAVVWSDGHIVCLEVAE